MRIGILQTDSVLPQFQADFGDYPWMIQQVLARAAPLVPAAGALDYAVFNVEAGEYPAHIDDCDGYVITGSKRSAYEDEAWIHTLSDYILLLHEHTKPLVGICFGHQLIAMVLGGETTAATDGWGVGVHRSAVLQNADFMQPRLKNFSLLYSHKDQVTRLPDEAVPLATHDFCPNAMFRVGSHIFAFQGHPEFIKDYAATLLEMRRELVGEQAYRAAVNSFNEATDEAVIGAWMLRLIAA